jgi:hypothetical protein
MRAAGYEDDFVKVMGAIYAVARFGRAAGTSDTFEKLVGRKPHTLGEWAEENAACWVP